MNSNQIKGLPNELGQLKKLKELWVKLTLLYINKKL